MKLLVLLVAAGTLFAQGTQDTAANWPQFRGPNSSGVAAASSAPPVEFGKQHLLWKQAVPEGHSSPAVWGERIFLTAFDPASQKLELLCLSSKAGAILWRHGATAEQIEHTHEVSNPATATPAVDAERVYAYFGSYGLMAFNHAGEAAWSLPLPMPRTSHGSGASPILVGNNVILNHDGIQGGYLLAVDRKTGKEVWKQPYPTPGGRRESYSTPIFWHDQLVLHRAGVVDAYDAASGQPKWSLLTPTSGLSTPVASSDTIFAQTWYLLGEGDQRGTLPDFATLLKKYDKDGDGKISEAEFPTDLVHTARPGLEKVPNSQNYVGFRSVDRDRDGFITKEEWEGFLAVAAGMVKDHGMLALRPDGSTAKIVWREDTSIPEVPSPLLYKNRLFLVRNGGVLSCLDAATGKVIYRARTGATGPYFASPVEAGGRLYLVSGDGVVTVISAEKDSLDVLAKNELGEDVYSSPAIAGNAFYVRTSRSLLAFGER
jgi:outer membrane protein assembly factor BamB